jgi:hypothetical protein
MPLCLHTDGSKNSTAGGNDCATRLLKAKGVYKCWEQALARSHLHPREYTNVLIRLIKDVVADARAQAKVEAKGKGAMSSVFTDEDDPDQEWESYEHLLVGSSRVEQTMEPDPEASSSSSSSSSSSAQHACPRPAPLTQTLSADEVKPKTLKALLRYRFLFGNSPPCLVIYRPVW